MAARSAVCALVIFVLAVGSIDAAPKPPKPLVCKDAKLNLLAENCCNTSAKPLFTAAQMKACNKDKDVKDPKMLAWVNAYTVFTLQVVPKKGAVNLNQSIAIDKGALGKSLCKFAPFVSCLFNNSGLLYANGTLNMTAVSIFFTATQTDPAFQDPVSEEALSQFDGSLDGNFTSISCGSTKNPKKESLLPLMLTQLVQGTFIEACPAPVNNTNTKLKNLNCDASRIHFYNCTTMLATQVFTNMPAGEQFALLRRPLAGK